ncbi:MAG: alpha-L-arabinofuranosidase C-terminal domain-containing protein [bacterium]|nr:alpha-L-arabinofuranosidase C-terminal domain-containing protein [bacterium]
MEYGEGTLTIDLSKPGKPISPMLYGVFFEDINRAADGGLYGNLIANGSFDYGEDEDGNDMSFADWEPSGDAELTIKRKRPVNEINTNYINIKTLRSGGIRSKGFGGDGFGVRRDEGYRISFKARSVENTVLSFRIWADCREIAEASVSVGGNEWKDYNVYIKSPSTKPHAELEILLPLGGQADIDCITMFPLNTFKRRKNGMRKDIARMIRDLKPKFMRFPGGCVVEGRSIATMYNWKNSIGDVSERRVNSNRWQLDEYQRKGRKNRDYFQSLGLGFYEYFQFCEDIGAEPVPVMNCGMTCQWHEALKIPLEALQPWIDDVLDLIEFANGAPDTEWGAKRAGMGHPEPFNLKYIGIGNEQWGTEYFERYERFFEEISEKHPEIKLITSAGWNSEGEDFDLAVEWMNGNKEKAFAVDEHFYKSPEWFLENIHRYDGYDRTMPKVFAGEYACHTAKDIDERRNNFKAALCEAAFMTGMENNADHVWMACYAPLLEKDGFEQWKPNLIRFNNLEVYGTPSYYVQKEFSTHYGSELIRSDCDLDFVSVSSTTDGDRLFIKIVNTSADKQARLTLETPGSVLEDAEAEETVFRAAPEAENSFENPEAVKPVMNIRNLGTGSEIIIDSGSIIILTIR